MKYAILGPIELCRGERQVSPGGPRQVALLALLLLNANRPISSDTLIDAVWGELGSEGALKRLQVAIARLRRVLDADGVQDDSVLRTVAGSYLLVVRPGECDAQAFQMLAEDGRRALDGGDPQRAREVLRDALRTSGRRAGGLCAHARVPPRRAGPRAGTGAEGAAARGPRPGGVARSAAPGRGRVTVACAGSAGAGPAAAGDDRGR